MRTINAGFRSKGWRLAAVTLLCGGLTAMAGLASSASATSAPRTTVLSNGPSISAFGGDGTFAPATPGPVGSTSIGRVLAGIAFDRSGDTYFADVDNNYVYKVTTGGTLSIVAGNELDTSPTPGPATSSSIGQPTGLAVDQAGNLYIASFDNAQVYKVTPGGTLSIYAGDALDTSPTPGPATSSSIGQPVGLVLDSSGDLYIASNDNSQVYKVTPGGTLSVFAGMYGESLGVVPGPATSSSIGYPDGLAIDRAGNIYIADYYMRYVYKVTPGGTLSIFAGDNGEGAGTAGSATHTSVGFPEYVTVDFNGNVFITDDHNELLYEVTPSGNLSVYAGQAGSHAGATPGPASASAVGAPEAVAVDPANGNLYLSSTASGNSYIYRITPAPGYWLAGAGGYVSGVDGAVDYGSLTTSSSNPVVGIASDSNGYWLVTKNGSVHTYGDAVFYKDLPTLGVHVSNIVAIAPTADHRGYWLIGADGGEFAFGDATYHGSLPGLGIHVDNIVGMVANPSGSGYILVGSDGGVFVFGGSFHGSLPGLGVHVNNIVGILPTGGGAGYVLVGSDGGAFVFGHGSGFYGSLPGQGIHVNDVVGLALSPDQGGYWMAEANGNVHPFGDAPSLGTPAGSAAHQPVVGIGAS